MRITFVDVVNAAFELEHSPVPWLTHMGETLQSAIPEAMGFVAHGYTLDPNRENASLPIHVQANPEELEDLPTHALRLMEQLRVSGSAIDSRDISRRHDSYSAVITARSVFGDGPEFHSLFERWSKVGAHDVIGLLAADTTVSGVAVGAAMRQTVRLFGARRRQLESVAKQLHSAVRLRSALAGGSALDQAAAIFTPGGRVQDCNEEACPPPLREKLHSAVNELEKARASAARDGDPELALNIWNALADGRWALVDHYENDGQRFVVALPLLEPCEHRRLTPQERAVAEGVAGGASNKVVAYDVGLSEPLVKKRLSSVLRKLGLDSRVDLVRLFASLPR